MYKPIKDNLAFNRMSHQEQLAASHLSVIDLTTV